MSLFLAWSKGMFQRSFSKMCQILNGYIIVLDCQYYQAGFQTGSMSKITSADLIMASALSHNNKDNVPRPVLGPGYISSEVNALLIEPHRPSPATNRL